MSPKPPYLIVFLFCSSWWHSIACQFSTDHARRSAGASPRRHACTYERFATHKERNCTPKATTDEEFETIWDRLLRKPQPTRSPDHSGNLPQLESPPPGKFTTKDPPRRRPRLREWEQSSSTPPPSPLANCKRCWRLHHGFHHAVKHQRRSRSQNRRRKIKENRNNKEIK